jgi:hypothetical protein
VRKAGSRGGAGGRGRAGSGGGSGRGRQQPEKHTAFFRLLEACGEPQCPVCHLVRRRMERYFDGLLYEKVNDRELRRRFREAGGFCTDHSHQFAGYHDALAGSILYRDLLVTWLERGSGLPVRDSSGGLPDCPACREKNRREDTALALMADFLEDEQLKAALLASDGLCLPHLARLEERLKSRRLPLPGWLMDLQRALAERLVAQLGTYVDSCNFSLGEARPEPTPEQERAWQRALCKIAGFSPEAPEG